MINLQCDGKACKKSLIKFHTVSEKHKNESIPCSVLCKLKMKLH